MTITISDNRYRIDVSYSYREGLKKTLTDSLARRKALDAMRANKALREYRTKELAEKAFAKAGLDPKVYEVVTFCTMHF